MRDTTGKRAAARVMTPLALVLGLAGCAVTGDPPISLEERFYQVAFYDEDFDVEQSLIKRSSDIRLLVEGGTEADREKINDILGQISEVTGLAVVDAESWADANTVVKFLSDEEWEDFEEADKTQVRSGGIWALGYYVKCAIDLLRTADPDPVAIIRIPDRLSGIERERCIAQEVGHSTGLLYDTDHLTDTVFSGLQGATYITSVDKLLLRIHADPRLKAIMTWEEARPIVQQIISELEAG